VSYLLDTNVVSEWVQPRPDAHVRAWLAGADESEIFLSVATLAELRQGIEIMSKGKRRDWLETWLAGDLRARFAGRILSIDERIAEAWGAIMARGRRAGTPVAAMDGFFAATAEVHGLTLATRNVGDFAKLGIALFNPWPARP
jgi:hypothetical protein